jgi:arylsulfatase
MKIPDLFIALAGTPFIAPHVRAQENPNIIIVFMDDMGYGDIASNGAVQYNTPNIDHLAASGMRFTNFYAAQAVSSASRAGLMTGCYPNRIGITGALNPTAQIGLNKEEETIPEILKKRGYKTAAVGKWHLGHHREFLPLQHGFDEYFGLPYSNDMWPVGYDGSRNFSNKNARKSKFPELPLIEGNQKIAEIRTLDDQAKLTTWYTEKAVDFIIRSRENPFFLYLAHSMPHVPLAVSDKFKNKSEQGLYGDVMMEIDWSVGKIMRALEESGIADNTLVILTSDNGPWLQFGNHGGSAGGLREGKGTVFEGGHRVPCIMKWPDAIPQGSVCNKMASTIDILPTLAAITHAELPEKKIDGVNILPLLYGEDAHPREMFLYYYDRNNLKAIRKGNWKLVFPHSGRTNQGFFPGVDGESGKTDGNHSFEEELFDLRRDPGERYNLKEMHPEIILELKELADMARKDLGDDLNGIKGENSREPGRIKE